MFHFFLFYVSSPVFYVQILEMFTFWFIMILFSLILNETDVYGNVLMMQRKYENILIIVWKFFLWQRSNRVKFVDLLLTLKENHTEEKRR